MKQKWRKGELSRTIVMLCIKTMLAVLAWAAVLTTISAITGWQTDLSPVLTFAGGFFGGELLLLAFKRIFAKEKNNEEDFQ